MTAAVLGQHPEFWSGKTGVDPPRNALWRTGALSRHLPQGAREIVASLGPKRSKITAGISSAISGTG